jgi:undecaprenyl-diphosphatase
VNELDAKIFLSLHQATSGSIILIAMAALTILGSGWSMLAFLPLFAMARTRRFVSALAAVLVSTSILVFVLKRVVGRTRPCAALAGVHARVFAPPTDFSFPSGHSAGAFAFASFVALLLLRRAVRNDAPSAEPVSTRVLRILGAASLFVLAASVALSRIALGVHFPSDIAAGAVLGSTIGLTGALLYLGPRAVFGRAQTTADPPIFAASDASGRNLPRT